MKNKYKSRCTIPSIIKAIQETEDAAEINKYENMLVSMYSSVLMFLASIVNFVVYYLIQSQRLSICLFNSLLFLIIGILFEVVVRIGLKDNLVTPIISGLSCLTLVFITIRFYDIIGPAVWTIAFIQLMLAMMRITRVMLYYIAFAILMSNIYIIYHFFHALSFHMDITYYIVQLVLFMISWVVSAAVHKVNINRYQCINKQLNDVRTKNKEINSLYKKIKSSEIEIKHIAYHDHLTGLPNRLFLFEQLNHAILLSSRMNKMLATMFLDLDDFKMINDTMGHDIGDQLLIEVSKRLLNILRECDIVARIGGDEFIILIKDVDNMDYINLVSKKIIKCFNEPFMLNNQECFVTTSIGIAIYPTDGKDSKVLVKNADIAMYNAKGKGNNEYVIYTSPK